MSLKTFHILFIFLSVGLSALFAWWASQQDNKAISSALMWTSIVVGGVMLVYGFLFWQKIKKLNANDFKK